MSAAWMITKDVFRGVDAKAVFGPSGATDEQCARLRAGEGKAFRMLDDDGELCYEGRIIDSDGTADDEFSPLDGYGTPDAGANTIEYRNAAGAWEAI